MDLDKNQTNELPIQGIQMIDELREQRDAIKSNNRLLLEALVSLHQQAHEWIEVHIGNDTLNDNDRRILAQAEGAIAAAQF
jgi:hypothetical protein